MCNISCFENITRSGDGLVGHTCEDIDKIFSVISRKLKQMAIFAKEDTLSKIGEKFRGMKGSIRSGNYGEDGRLERGHRAIFQKEG